MLTEPHALRKAYQKEIGEFLDQLKRAVRWPTSTTSRLRTDVDLDLALSGYLASRAMRVK